MKTIKINKSFRNGIKVLYVIVPDDYSDFQINESVEEECNKDLCGQSYGYNTEWEVETDIDVTTKVITDKITNIDYKRSKLEKERDNLTDYLYDINISQLNKDPF